MVLTEASSGLEQRILFPCFKTCIVFPNQIKLGMIIHEMLTNTIHEKMYSNLNELARKLSLNIFLWNAKVEPVSTIEREF